MRHLDTCYFCYSHTKLGAKGFSSP